MKKIKCSANEKSVGEDVNRDKRLKNLYENLIFEAENNLELINELKRLGLSQENATKAALIVSGRVINKKIS
ncbi:hypothetical protein [Listeria booriae]|uniref:hypothetical protein n=1 Tax=Listeria booriae TaxID=1552123 RepID=UPI001623FE2C|nr:hypothetical protein [Listeria booriae]MBC2389039.1 hypothetical protein [Listeria booriae]